MVSRIRRRGMTGPGGGGVVASERDTPTEYGEGGPTVTSETLSVIPELSVDIAASEGDVLLVSLTGTFGTNSGSPATGLFDYTVDGVTQFPDTLKCTLEGVDSELISWTDTHIVTAGEVTAGQVTVEPLWGSLSMGLQRRPIFNVINLGAAT
jgi:hypothetical protein